MFTHRQYFTAIASCMALAAMLFAEQPAAPTSAVGPLLRILQSGDLPPDRLGFVLNVFAERGNAYDLGVVYAKATSPDGYTGVSRELALESLAIAARRRNVKPDGDLSKLAALIDETTRKESPQTYALVIELAGLWQLETAAPAIAKIVTTKSTGAKLRTSALNALVNIGGDQAESAIANLTAASQPQPLRYLGVAALARLNLEAAVEQATAALAAATSNDDPAAMIDALLEQQKGAEQFAAALSATEKEITPDVAKLVLRHIYAVGRSDEPLVNALSKVAGISTEVKLPSPEEMQKLIADVGSHGDPRRGEEIFRRARHELHEVPCPQRGGGQLGPDLVDLGGSQPVDYLIESVLLPEKAVKEEYQLARVTDYLEGKTYQGIIKEETDERIVLQGAQGEEIVVNIEDPEEIEIAKGGSLMPQGLVRFLTRDELVDLVSFLGVLGRADTLYEKNTAPILRRWRILRDVPEEIAEGITDDEAFLDQVYSTDASAWDAVYSGANGRLPVGQLAGEETRFVFVRGEIEVVAAGNVGIELAGCAKPIVWIDETRAAIAGKGTVELNAGVHSITIQVDTQNCDAQGLELQLFTPEANAAEVQVVNGA